MGKNGGAICAAVGCYNKDTRFVADFVVRPFISASVAPNFFRRSNAADLLNLDTGEALLSAIPCIAQNATSSWLFITSLIVAKSDLVASFAACTLRNS